MVGPDSDIKIDLNDIVNISEDEFKRQISSWIDEHGISRKLQSKLRADLFEHFNRTHLGRQMAEQHNLVHRIVLSPLVLVLNTLVADFLYAEDCHFTLSVFANEVPYKNTLPNFEATPAQTLFRFTESELKDIFEAIGVSKEDEKVVRQFYSNPVENGSSELLNRSLLYCLFRTITSRIQTEPASGDAGKSRPLITKSSTPLASSTQQSFSSSVSIEPYRKCLDCKRSWNIHDKFHISSRYFKYVNQYLDILSDRLNDVLKVVHEKPDKQNKTSADTISQESSLKKDLRKMVDNINRLTKSKRKSKRFQDILNSIEKLSATVDKCSQNMENLIEMAKIKTKSKNNDNNNLVESSSSSNNRKDRLKDMDYATWLEELKTSDNGKKFIDRLESSIQKVMEKERTNMQKLYDEKTNNYRMLIRLHYKQKYDVENKNVKPTESQPVQVSSADKISTDSAEKELAESLATKAIEKEHHVNEIVQSAKARLQELERESEQLDESFQSYLRRQKMMKRQMNDDVTHIWDSYNLSKAALEQYDSVSGKANLMNSQPKFVNTTNIDRALNFELNENDDETILREFEEIRQVKSPQFDRNEIFSKETVFGSKKPMKGHDTIHATNTNLYTLAREKLQKEFNELSGLALKATTTTSISKKWNPMKEKEIETWKTKVNENNTISNCRHLEETIDDFYRKMNENQTEKHCGVPEDKMIPVKDGNKTQPEINPRNEQENSPIKSQNKIFTTESKRMEQEIEPKGSTNTLNHLVERDRGGLKIVNDSKSSDNDSANIEKEEHIEPTVIITSKIGKLNLNGNLTNPKNVFTKLSSIESDEDSSIQISIGPMQPSKSDDFWI